MSHIKKNICHIIHRKYFIRKIYRVSSGNYVFLSMGDICFFNINHIPILAVVLSKNL